MKILATIFAFAIALSARAESASFERIADAIYLAEGGAKAKSPYGILSVKVKDTADARRVCLNTIRNNHARWLASGRRQDFICFLADRYCPQSVDPVGNRRWKKNVSFFISRPQK